MSIIWQSTFDIAEWTQADGLGDAAVGVVGDGISGYGGWTTVNGREDQVTTAANYPGGGGGRGFRHWRGDGDNNNGGGLRITLPVSQPEVWMRWYMRFSAGFAFQAGFKYTKDIYWNGGGGNYCIFGVQDGDNWGLSDVLLTGQGGTESVFDTWGGAVGDGQWHCFENHIKRGAGGILEIWIDDVQVMSRTGLTLHSENLTHFLLGENQYFLTGGGAADHYTDYDDIAISDSARVGPLGGGGLTIDDSAHEWCVREAQTNPLKISRW